MKKIMKLFRIFLITVVGSLMVSCYNDFDMPSPAPVYNDETMEAMGMTHISIYDLKKMFGTIDGTGSTNVSDGLDKTMYKRFVLDEAECTDWEKQTNRYIVGNYYIKGKVISNDEQGNIYKSLYIYDGTAAIELKLTNGLYLDYFCNLDKIGTGEEATQWVYVKLHGLYMGNFRMMLSIGDIPTESLNSYGRPKFYPNSNINSPIKVRDHVFPGERDVLTEGVLSSDGSNKNDYDVLKVNESNYDQLLYKNSDGGINYFGRLIRFEGVKMAYRGVTNQEGDTPDVLDGGYYPAWICTSGTMKSPVYNTVTGSPVEGCLTTKDGMYVKDGNLVNAEGDVVEENWLLNSDGLLNEARFSSIQTTPLVVEFKDSPWGKLAYSNNNISLYGQMVVGFGDKGQTALKKSEAGVYVVRTSGYSRYAGKVVPRDGTQGDILAIYSIYSKSTSQGYEAYQLTPCRFDDIFPSYYENITEEEQNEMDRWALSTYEDGGVMPFDSYFMPQTTSEDDAEE